MLGCALSLFVGFGVPVLSIFHCFECVTDLVTCYATVFAEISRRNRVLFNMMMHDTGRTDRPVCQTYQNTRRACHAIQDTDVCVSVNSTNLYQASSSLYICSPQLLTIHHSHPH